MPKLKNPKHELLAKKIIENKFNLTKSYQETYPSTSYDSANANVSRLLANDSRVVNRIEELANKAGLTLEKELAHLERIHHATKPVSIGKKLIDYPDYSVQLEATKTALKIHGALSENNTNIDARSVNVTISPHELDRIESVTARIEALRKPKASQVNQANSQPS